MYIFEAAAGDPSLTTELVESIRSAAASAVLAFSDDPFWLVQTASENPAFKASVQSGLSQIAAAHGYSFEPEVSATMSEAKGVLDALRDKPTQVPIGTPIALLWIAAALIFLPSVLGVAGGAMFGSDEIAHAIEAANSAG